MNGVDKTQIPVLGWTRCPGGAQGKQVKDFNAWQVAFSQHCFSFSQRVPGICLTFTVPSSRSHIHKIHSTVIGKNRWEFITEWQRTWHPEAENNMKVLSRICPSYKVVRRSSRSSSCGSCPGPRQPSDNKAGNCFLNLKATGFWLSGGTGTNRSLLSCIRSPKEQSQVPVLFQLF